MKRKILHAVAATAAGGLIVAAAPATPVNADDATTGTFGPTTFFSVAGNGTRTVAVGDVNSDGKLDVAIARHGKWVVVARERRDVVEGPREERDAPATVVHVDRGTDVNDGSSSQLRRAPRLSNYSVNGGSLRQLCDGEVVRAPILEIEKLWLHEAGIHITVVYPVSTETEFRSAMSRDYGYTVAGLGPKQSADDVARAVIACLKRPRPEVYPHRLSKLLAVLNAVAPGAADRLVRKYGRRREHTS